MTVAVLPSALKTAHKLESTDVRTEWFSGTGKGGQKRNKSQSCCRLIHIPSGITITRQGRSRKNNYASAYAELSSRLHEQHDTLSKDSINIVRKHHVGTGGRDSKIVTIRMQDDRVINHITGKKLSAKQYMNGFMDGLW